jgi:IS5 family transposase
MQQTFTDMEYARRKKKTRKEIFLAKMEEVVPWGAIIRLIEPYYYSGERGRPPVPLAIILRMYLLSIWYGMSDPQTEDEIYSCFEFRAFLGINFNEKGLQVPDESCLCNFRHLLETHGLGEKIFALISGLLEENGLIMRGGTIADATIISSAKSTKNKERKRDPEMASTKKGSNYYFGSKLHIGVDAGSGYVHSLETTAANEHDVSVAHKLIREDDDVFSGDSGYIGMEKRDEIINDERLSKIEYRIVKRPSGRRKIKNYNAVQWEKIIESGIIRARQKVEYPFHIMKNIFGYKKNSYKGINKNHNRNAVTMALVNLYMAASAGRKICHT